MRKEKVIIVFLLLFMGFISGFDAMAEGFR